MLLSQLPMTFMLQQLNQNPSVGLFPFYTSDYPAGVTRAALLAAFQALAGASGNYDSVTGAWNTQVYAPGIIQNAGAQIPASPGSTNVTTQTVPTGLVASANANIPTTVNPVGAGAAGSSPAFITKSSEVI